MKISSNDTLVSSGAIFDQARDRDLNRFLDDDAVGCVWCGDGIVEHSDNLDWLEFVSFEHEYYHSNCFNRFIEQQEDKIIRFIQHFFFFLYSR